MPLVSRPSYCSETDSKLWCPNVSKETLIFSLYKYFNTSPKCSCSFVVENVQRTCEKKRKYILQICFDDKVRKLETLLMRLMHTSDATLLLFSNIFYKYIYLKHILVYFQNIYFLCGAR